MNSGNIAAQVYTVREFLKTPAEIEASLAKVKAIGYDSVQVSGMGPIEPERLKDITDRLGLTICSTHTTYQRYKDDLDNVIREHKLWGSMYPGIGSMPEAFRTSREGYAAFIREFDAISRKIADNGLKFQYHNHKFEFQKFDGVCGMDILLDETDPQRFGFILDTYWVQAGGANPVSWIHKAKGRVDLIHFKDMAVVDNEQVFAEIGQGNLEWDAIIKACRDTGVKWYAVEQDTCAGDPFESLAMSRRYLQRYI